MQGNVPTARDAQAHRASFYWNSALIVEDSVFAMPVREIQILRQLQLEVFPKVEAKLQSKRQVCRLER